MINGLVVILIFIAAIPKGVKFLFNVIQAIYGLHKEAKEEQKEDE